MRSTSMFLTSFTLAIVVCLDASPKLTDLTLYSNFVSRQDKALAILVSLGLITTSVIIAGRVYRNTAENVEEIDDGGFSRNDEENDEENDKAVFGLDDKESCLDKIIPECMIDDSMNRNFNNKQRYNRRVVSKNKVKTVSSFEYKKFKNIGKLENLEAFLAKLPEDQLIYQRKGQKLGCSDKVMQDYVISGENQCVQLVALADGHGTSDVVKLIADPEHGIKNILKTEGVVSRQAIGEAYHKINTDCKTQLAEINKANGDSKDDNVISGSTLSTVLVDSMNTTAATVGNTPVIFVTNEGEICISTDHNKDNPDEVKRFPEPQNEQTPAAPIFKFSRFWNTDKSYSLEISRDFGSASAEHEKFKPVPYINQKPTNKIAFFALLTDGALKESNGKTFLNELVSSMLSIQDCEKFTSKNLGAAYQSINRKKPPVPYQSFHDRDDESIILCRPKKAFRQNQSLSNDSQS